MRGGPYWDLLAGYARVGVGNVVRVRNAILAALPWINWSYHSKLKLIGLGFTLPVLLYFGLFNVYPIVYAGLISLHKFDLFTPMQYVGLGNYANLLTDRNFLKATGVTLRFIIIFGLFAGSISFAMALLLRERIVGRTVFRSLFYFPTLLSAVAMAAAWSLLLRRDGPINAVLGLSIPWLTSEKTALLGIMLMSIWQGIGWYMITFLAGLQSVPGELHEAAQIDGANRWQSLRYITLPLMRPVFALVAVQTVIGGMKVFTPMFLLTRGGPNNSTRSLSMLIFHEGLRDLRFGSASAMSMVGFIVVLIVTFIQLRIFRIGEEIGE